MTSYDCVIGIGVCEDMDCATKGDAWESLYCTGPGLIMTSYDCATDTGVCEDIDCAAKGDAWESLYCTGTGLSMTSYDCATDTGVCFDSSCLDKQSAWKELHCNGPDLVLSSFDCVTNTGVCQDNDFVPDPELEDVSEFTDRFTKFINDLKATPLFALPGQILGNIPTGGEPIYTINMGQYGSANVDLSEYSGVFKITRSVLLICFSFAGLRIVVSKR
jgi:hypothetical protein